MSVRLTRVGEDILDSLEAKGQSAVLAFFHGRQMLLTWSLLGRKLGVMSSLSRDGELQARTLAGFGYAIVRGSASRGGARGLIGLMRLMERGYHATMAVDGPRGPLNSVKPGAVFLAKKTGSPLVLMAASAAPARVFVKAWDRFLLPWPLSRAVVMFQGPVELDDDLSEEAVERDCRRVEKEMLLLQAKADGMVGFVEP